jgi:GTPase SAR1 family protein
MDIKITENSGKSIATVEAGHIIISNLQDAVDLIGNCYYQGAVGILLHEEAIDESFFDLKTRFAGEVLQKFSTYQMRLAIVGNFSKYESKSLRDFIFESNKAGKISFVSSVEEAQAVLVK